MYKAGRWREALAAFSTAAAFAPQNAEGVGKDLSLAFANRSGKSFNPTPQGFKTITKATASG
jgi:hypothetical protein